MVVLVVYVFVEDWGDGGIINWFKEEMNFCLECILSFLEFLKVFFEVIRFYCVFFFDFFWTLY